MRIRFAQTERHLMDAFGIFWDLPNLVYGGRVMPPRPISNHLRVTPDFVHFNGYFVLASDQTDHTVGQPQSGLWWGNIDDLWSFGKPKGWGSLWKNQKLAAGYTSDPFSISGFEKKSIHLLSAPGSNVQVDVQVDVTGDGDWRMLTRLDSGSAGYAFYTFPEGYGAHWVRGVVRKSVGTSTVTLHLG